ncbi:uncharacterized protein RHO25_009164 [Cercospora beticola]|uniref:Uncharacterized protein n=1 Tax=Cercospora beticola TaxID=122368 RepID=A0ABZ0NY46_CERBT|nr:hypothetical protein RHO25_009164 [Cercospora beticola]CAK1364261.1 unnamed protein product [Cercospora beticola]
MPFDSPDISTIQPIDQELDPNTAVDTPVKQKKKLSAADHLLARSAARESAAGSND